MLGVLDTSDKRTEMVSSLVHVFQLAMLAGSLSEEQIMWAGQHIFRELDEILAMCWKGEARQLRRKLLGLRKELKPRKSLADIHRVDFVLGSLTSSSPDSPFKHLPGKYFQWDHLQLLPTNFSKEGVKGVRFTLMGRVMDMYKFQETLVLPG